MYGCDLLFSEATAKKVRQEIEEKTGKPCPCTSGKQCPLLPADLGPLLQIVPRAAWSRGVTTPAHSVPRVPNQPATPTRTVRVPDELWRAAQRVAADRGETVTDVIIRALVRYVRAHPLDDD